MATSCIKCSRKWVQENVHSLVGTMLPDVPLLGIVMFFPVVAGPGTVSLLQNRLFPYW